MKNFLSSFVPVLFFAVFTLSFVSHAQGLYTARGYWEESNKPIYREIKQKQLVGDPLTEDEASYLTDFEEYLNNYYQRLSEVEKAKYQQMKEQWDRELLKTVHLAGPIAQEFEWRGRDRAINIGYGIIYGVSIAAIAEIDNAAALGIPLITGGLWALGPIMNPKKYEDIDRSVLRASNTGKLLGYGYGAAAGLMFGGEGDNTWKLALGLGTLGSIALGEVGFQTQKKKRFSEGHIEMLRLYGFIGPWLAGGTLGALRVENSHVFGAGFLVGGIGGLIVGNKVSQKYPYTRGDVDNITSLTVTSTGIGLAVMTEILRNDDVGGAALLIPMAGTVLGTWLGQRSVKGVNLTNKQGSTILFSSAGAALIGLGIVAIAESQNPTVWIAVPTLLGLGAQQILFQRFKQENLANQSLSGKLGKDRKFDYTLKVTPENYFVNKQMAGRTNIPGLNPNPTHSLVNFKLSF
ncbi:hypothetical protein [Shivajiella indica]|uniref:Uncharacterized protein n=1 Tax=Shivajiella indica TaxID=872115 RepID=A0ABW5B4L4_9BACT